MCGNQNLTDAGLAGVAACARLSQLNLTWCTQISDAGVAAVAAVCQQLTWLSLHGIRSITDASIDALAAACAGSLHTLDVAGCVGISARDQAALRAKLPRLVCFLVHS